MAGLIYVIDFGDKIKVGTTDNLKQRIKYLERENMKKCIRYFYTEKVEFNYKLEKHIHKIFKHYKIKGEYFKLNFINAVFKIKKINKEKYVLIREIKENIFKEYDDFIKIGDCCYQKNKDDLFFSKKDIIEKYGNDFFINELGNKIIPTKISRNKFLIEY